jgi:hypothetical protein
LREAERSMQTISFKEMFTFAVLVVGERYAQKYINVLKKYLWVTSLSLRCTIYLSGPLHLAWILPYKWKRNKILHIRKLIIVIRYWSYQEKSANMTLCKIFAFLFLVSIVVYVIANDDDVRIRIISSKDGKTIYQ